MPPGATRSPLRHQPFRIGAFARVLPMNLQRAVGLSGADPDSRVGDADGALAMIASLNNLGSLLGAQGDLAGARQHLERAVLVAEAAFGPDNPDVGTCLNNLGSVMQDQGDLAGARVSYERALAIAEAAYWTEDPGLATRLSNLGCLLRDQGDLVGARIHMERALIVAEAAVGHDHGEVDTIRENLSRVVGESEGTDTM